MLSEQQRKEREAQVKREKAERLEASNTRKKEMQGPGDDEEAERETL